MTEGLFIIEGGSGSGKSTVLRQLENEGFVVIRGMASQHSEENKKLTPKAQTILNGRELDFKKNLLLPPVDGAKIFKDCTKIYLLQFAEARSIAETQHTTVLLGSSIIRLRAHAQLIWSIAIQRKDERLAELCHLTYEDLIKKSYKGTTGVNGIIHMTTPFLGFINKTSISGYEAFESSFITYEIDEITRGNSLKIPVTKINTKDYAEEGGIFRMVDRIKYFLDQPFIR